MDAIPSPILAAGLAWASGLRLYATVFLVGMAGRLGWVHLPDKLALLGTNPVLIVAGVLMLLEFFADKVPALDSLNDAVQTFIRIPAGAALAWGALGDASPAVQFAAALLGGTIAGSTHLAKAGSRALVNTSPEPFSNVGMSLGGDGVTVAGLWLLFAHPWAFGVLLLLFLLSLVWLLPKLWRGVRMLWRRLSGKPPAPAAGT
jgi:hypothetical protein